MNGETIRTITIRGQSEGLDKLTADVNKLAAAQENVAVVSEQSARRVLSLEDAWKRQTMRLDEAARAQANIARETKVADAALREGLATQAQHAQRLEQINQRYTKTADATKVVAHQTGLARHELVNLGRQAQDVGVSLASGQSPFTVLVQQGTQIADVFATSGGTIRGFFSQAASWAKTFFTSTTGIVTGVLAVGAAAVYAASQFRTASTTIEQALEEQNRLLKEAKTLLDAKTSAEAKAFAQSKELTQFQLERSERDLKDKIRSAQEDAAIAARRRSTRPTQVGGEMGEAPTGVASLGPGYEQIAEAVDKLNAAMAAGQPGLAAFQEELAKVGRAHPELAQTAEEMIKLAQSGIQAEQAALKVRAVSDALKGVATDAQLAAVGLGSIAQFNLGNLGAEQAAAATERMAQHTLAIAASYPGMSIEVAKQLDALQGQLTIAQARTAAEQIVTQEYVTQTTLQAQGKTLSEAMAIAAGQRAIAEANVSKSIADQIQALNDEIALSKARVQGTEDAVKAEQAYANAVRQGASELDAQALKSATRAASNQKNNEQMKTNAQLNQEIDAELGNIGEQIQQNTIYAQQFTAEIQRATTWSLSLADAIEEAQSHFSTSSQFKEGGYVSSWDPLGFQAQAERYEAQGIPFKWETKGIGLGTYQMPVRDYDAIREGLSDLVTSNEDLTESTDSLNATMQNALSPYYSQDPRTTKLGFRAGVTGNPDWMTGATNANPLVAVLGAGATAPGMADGGSFTVGGGYSANDNAMAVFPVASGEEVIVNRNKGGRGGRVVNNIDNRIIIQGSVDTDTLSQMKVSRYQQAQRMRSQLAG